MRKTIPSTVRSYSSTGVPLKIHLFSGEPMRREANIFYQCAVGVAAIALTLYLFRMNQAWHLKMMMATLSQPVAVAPGEDEKRKAKFKEDSLRSDELILATAREKPFFSFYSSDEDAAIKTAKADLEMNSTQR